METTKEKKRKTTDDKETSHGERDAETGRATGGRKKKRTVKDVDTDVGNGTKEKEVSKEIYGYIRVSTTQQNDDRQRSPSCKIKPRHLLCCGPSSTT